jgi:hypothetical protein
MPHTLSRTTTQDVSRFRVVPDHQEVWSHVESDQSVIIEINQVCVCVCVCVIRTQ